MAAKYDLEDLVLDFKTMLQAKLNAEIAAVEAQKVAQGFAAASPLPIQPEGYFELAWNDASLNISPALGIFVADHKEFGEGEFTKTQYTLEVGIVLQTTNDATSTRKLLRYMKALKQCFEANWGKINNCVTREKIETIGPIDFTLNIDSADNFKIAGISVTCVLG